MDDANAALLDGVRVEHIGLNIEACVNLKGMTLAWLSEEVMVPAPVLSRYAEGQGKVSENVITKISEALGVPEEVITHQFSDRDRSDVIRKALAGEDYILEHDTLCAMGSLSTAVVLQPSDEHPDWWKSGGSGRVPLWALAPDPDQPRQYMDPDQLAALAESVRQRGVRQAITVTPLSTVPWARFDKEAYPNALFLIVSGLRRTEAGLMAGVLDAPAEVKLYDSKTDHLIDGSLLNDLQAKLTPLEQGYELKRLRETVTLERLSKIRGMSVQTIIERLSLTKLDPWIQKYRLHPAHLDQRAPSLSLKVAAKLGGLTPPNVNTLRIIAAKLNQPALNDWDGNPDEACFKLQRLLLQKIEAEGMGSVSACDFIDRIVNNKAVGTGTQSGSKIIRRAKEPRKMRERIHNTLRGMSEASIFSWEADDFGHAFDGAKKEQIRSYLEDAETAREALDELIIRLKKQLGE